METCIIFGAADFAGLAEPIRSGDFVLAADGGLVHLQQLGVEPDGIIGDFDSLGYVPDKAQVFPVEKDDTDTMLAARKGLELGYRRFVIYGGIGGARLDHTLANFQTLQFLADHGARAYLAGTDYLVTVLKEDAIAFPAEASGIVSIFCMGPDAEGVTISGLQYPLECGKLTSGFPLGVSNHFVGKPVRISVETGSIFVLWDRRNGIPTE